ncbi:MAG: ABC transporter ATP-binding protein [Actinomycetota bacterium]|uniref:ABC transporter domain-containing protein n=1 Tax=marine metagenome TaxID=408172 RepID=A0A381VZV0_9ZZZZ|nr:ABC transporter ATP-binding protein [Actinomycetota bacterium]MEC9270542.1 ABC transporter ATP-binding protein [Actinomycetota bacterium]MEE2807408.1 ABC transporter ATP-binding protein [Actinomycetota bacterium]|tara:strand:- start:481 stop:1275 length:795 start_codon:yes stop_codon:yes gene_type:complete
MVGEGEMLGLQASGLAKRFSSKGGDVQALEAVEIEVRQGGFTSIIGPSGCGKSTLLRLFSDLLEPSTGEVSVNGKSPAEARAAREFGVVFQSPNLLPWRTVLRNVTLPLQVMGVDRSTRNRTAHEMLELVGLEAFSRHHPWQLSGGMQQRVAIARALSTNPSVLLMDEPFGALDEITRDRLNLELMRIWGTLSATILFITHSITEAVFLSSQIAVMSSRPGRITKLIDVDLPYPRNAQTRDMPEFYELVIEVRRALVEASNAAA